MITYSHTPVLFKTAHSVTRQIPGRGKIFVKVGQEVLPHDVVGEGSESLGFRSFPLAQLLGLTPAATQKILKKVIGSYLYEGDLIAEVSKLGGLKKVKFRAPMEGILKYYDNKSGLLNLEYPPVLIKVPAGFKGQIKAIKPEESVEIETQAVVVFGRLGLGKKREGVLSVIPNPEVPITPEQITAAYSGKIIVGGSLLNKEVLYKSLAVRAQGIVTGGVAWRDFWQVSGRGEAVEDVGLTILVTEGFGNLPMQKEVYELLQKHDGRYVLLQGAEKKLIIPSGRTDLKEATQGQSGKSQLQLSEDEARVRFGLVRVGDRVRILSPPYLALFGKILSIGTEPTQTKSDLWVHQCVVEVAGKKVEVPVGNVEIIR